MNKYKLTLIVVLVLLLVGVTTVMAAGSPVVYDNWTSGNAAFECGQIGDYDGAYKVDAAAPDGTYPVDAFGNEITISNSSGSVFDWSSNFGVGAVIVKAGTGANVWFYDPQAKGDTGLYAYQNKEISHVTFCWQYVLDVSKTADTTFTRDFDWTIEKTADQTDLLLSQGQQFDVNYTVQVTKDAGTDSDWAVSGDIVIDNNTPIDFTITAVEDVVSDNIDASVQCEEDLPYSLLSGNSLTCTYETGLLDGTQRLNTATVTYYKTVGNDRTAEATADVIFSEPTTVIDNCVDISDSYAGPLGNVCTSETFNYTRTIKANDLECGENQVENTADLDSDDGVTEESSWTVTVEVACAQGCTLTPGYWKTHSEFGPAPYDDTWTSIGEDTLFFNSSQTYYDVLWTNPSGGNAYYILAHQYIAAELNFLNGADPSAAQAALDAATVLFNTYTPEYVATLKGKAGTTLRAQFIDLANILDQYNNGYIGPGHCSE
jgi:hypothetical protein